MKKTIVLFSVLCSISSTATTRYVALNGGNAAPSTNCTTATITYTQRYNKRKGTYKVKLVYKFLGGMPTKPGLYLQPPAGN